MDWTGVRYGARDGVRARESLLRPALAAALHAGWGLSRPDWIQVWGGVSARP